MVIIEAHNTGVFPRRKICGLWNHPLKKVISSQVSVKCKANRICYYWHRNYFYLILPWSPGASSVHMICTELTHICKYVHNESLVLNCAPLLNNFFPISEPSKTSLIPLYKRPNGGYLDVVGKLHPLQIAAEKEWKRMHSEVVKVPNHFDMFGFWNLVLRLCACLQNSSWSFPFCSLGKDLQKE